jgi:hypothetical protein
MNEKTKAYDAYRADHPDTSKEFEKGFAEGWAKALDLVRIELDKDFHPNVRNFHYKVKDLY